MTKILATAWTPEQWILVLTAVFGSFGAMVTGMIAAVKGNHSQQAATAAIQKVQEVHDEVHPPSDGVSLGQLAEGMAQVQHFMASLEAEKAKVPPPPSPTEIARDIQNGVSNG